MRRKLISVFTLFFILLSNVSFGLISFFSFVSEEGTCNISNAINIQEQYTLLFNLPKDFVDICVKIKDDLKILKVNCAKNLFFNSDNSFSDNSLFATLTTPLRLKTFYVYEKACIANKIIIYSKIFLMLFSILFIFYILRYVGLLKLFSSHDYTNIKQYGDLNFSLCLN